MAKRAATVAGPRYTRYTDIPQFTRAGGYQVDYPPDRFIIRIDEMVREEGLQLDPDFQRGHVWTERKQREYLEYFLRGGRAATTIFLNKPSWHREVPKGAYNEFVLLDGKQRIQAWRKFLANELRVFGSFANEFEDRLRSMKTMSINVNDLKTRAEVLRFYIDWNSGGVVHSDEEIERVRKLLEAEEVRT